MIEFILSMYLSIWFIIFIGIVAVVLNVFDHPIGSFILYAIALVSVFNTYTIPIWLTIAMVLAYIPIGIAWSLRRWKIFVREIIEQISDEEKLVPSYVEHLTDPKTEIPRIVNWIVNWPISVLARTLDDIIMSLRDLVRERLIGLYTSISEKVLKDK